VVKSVSQPRQGEIWWAESLDKRRPVLVVTRNEGIEVLSAILVAPITRTVRLIPTEVALGPSQGLKEDCAASFDNLVPIRKSYLVSRIGQLSVEQSAEICRALSALADC
jgi:mRNA interferase MazF